MRIVEHLDKISWSLADKVLFIAFGFISFYHMNLLGPSEFGIFLLLINIHAYLFVISDSFALQSLIQFYYVKDSRKRLNTLTLIMHTLLTLGISSFIYLLQNPFAEAFSEPKIALVAASLPLLSLVNIPRTYCLKLAYREQQMGYVFWINFAYFISMIALTVIMGSAGKLNSFGDLYLIYFTGTLLSSLMGILLTRSQLKFGFEGSPDLFKKMISFSVPNLITSALHTIPKQLDAYMIQFFFKSSELVGIYGSAKNLFRVFEEVINAASGLIYPSAVKCIDRQDKKTLSDVMTKSVSFILFFFIFIIAALELGLAEVVINVFLSSKYISAVGYFKVLMLSALGLPFLVLSTIMTALGKIRLVMVYVIISIVCWALGFFIIGAVGNPLYIAVPQIIYSLSIGLLEFYYMNKYQGFKVKSIFRAIPDTYGVIQRRLDKRKNKQ